MRPRAHAPRLPSGLVAFVKRDCPTCALVVPALQMLRDHAPLTVYTQDDISFPAGLDPTDDTSLAMSWYHGVETVPTLIRVEDGEARERAVGWHRDEWEALTGVRDLAPELPLTRPGCGSLSVDPERASELAVRFLGPTLKARRIDKPALEDEHELMYQRGFTDGLPVVPPTPARVLAMLEGTTRDPDDIVAVVPPDLVECSVEKVAINAVMAGCLPEYLPVVIAALEAACTDAFNMHGVMATTMPVGPVLIVNGPIRHRIGMNAGRNVFGQGNRANSTIGRAVQLTLRNVGGGRPGEIDCAAHGNPGKVGLCFAEDEEGSPFTPLSVARGLEAGVDAVTVFAGEGPRCIIDQLSRTPESLARSLAANIKALYHPKLVLAFDCILAIGPEHSRIFREAGWDRARLDRELLALCQIPGEQLIRGADGIAEGMPEGPAATKLGLPASIAGMKLPKYKPGTLLTVHCGGAAGLFSTLIGGWVGGGIGSQPVTRAITA